MGKRNERTVPGITMWTMVAIRLTHLIFQYSGEPEACTLNTTDQNAHILKNFDLNGKFLFSVQTSVCQFVFRPEVSHTFIFTHKVSVFTNFTNKNVPRRIFFWSTI